MTQETGNGNTTVLQGPHALCAKCGCERPVRYTGYRDNELVANCRFCSSELAKATVRTTPAIAEPTEEYAYTESCLARDEGRLSESGPAKQMIGVLDKARDIVCGSRNKAYGNPADNHGCTAAMWTAYLKRRGLLVEGAEVTAKDVCWRMIMLKASREAHWSQPDNALDCIGYAANSVVS
jgi:hypothetical protein